MKTLKFVMFSLFGFLGFIYLLIITYVYLCQGEMVFNASKLPRDYNFEFEGDFEEIVIPSSDNIKLHGILFKVKESKGLLFYLHGNSGVLILGGILPIFIIIWDMIFLFWITEDSERVKV
ncbi:MAG: hypothetical protein ACK4M4_01940 [Flavobacterium sp.]